MDICPLQKKGNSKVLWGHFGRMQVAPTGKMCGPQGVGRDPSSYHFLSGSKTEITKVHKLQKYTSNKRLLGAKGIATRSKDATSSSWP